MADDLEPRIYSELSTVKLSPESYIQVLVRESLHSCNRLR